MTLAPFFQPLAKLRRGDKVAVLSPSYAAPGQWPHIYELGLKRLREQFGLDPVAYPTTAKLGASGGARAADLIAAFENPEIKGVISTLGGDDQVTYVKNLPDAPFRENPKPYFGYSDNTHFMNHLWLNGVPSYYGGALFTQFAYTPKIDGFTLKYLEKALFATEPVELSASATFNDIGLGWDDLSNMEKERTYEPNEGWQWDGTKDTQGITWGGCLESLDEILRHGVRLPSLEQFENVILLTETSEEIPSHNYVRRVYRALGERGILERVQAVLVGRPKAWEFDQPHPPEWKQEYRQMQRQTTLETIRRYSARVPVVQNLDFGHTNPQICLPYGTPLQVRSSEQKISAQF